MKAIAGALGSLRVRDSLLLLYPLGSAAYFLIISVTLPSIMQDELVYLNSARGHLIDADYPNYLFFWAYSFMVNLGGNFYELVKLLNLIFHTATAYVVFVFLRRRLGFTNSLLAGFAYLCSGFVIFSSFLMPEAMYAFFAVTSILVFWGYWENQRPNVWLLISAAALVGLAQLVKPHGLFLVILVSFWILLGPKETNVPRVKTAIVYISTFIITRIAVGFALVGVRTLDFTGAYIGENDSPGSRLAETFSDPVAFIGQVVLNSLQHIIFLLFVLVIGVAYFTARKITPSKFFLFNAWLVIGLSVFIAGFESYVTIAGDDHSSRLLARHYEFLLPLVLLSIVYSRNQEERAEKRPSFGASLSLFGLAFGLISLSLSEGLIWSASGYSDSGITTALRTSAGTWIFVLVGLFSISYLARKEITRTGYIALTALAMAGPAVATTSIHLEDNSQTLPSDESAYYVVEKFSSVPGERILVLGSNKALTEASVFLMNKPADYRVFAGGAAVVEPDLSIFDYDLVVQHTDIFLSGVESATHYGEGFAVTDVRQLDPNDFTKE